MYIFLALLYVSLAAPGQDNPGPHQDGKDKVSIGSTDINQHSFHRGTDYLEGRVHSFALTMDCPIQARPRGETSNTNFPDSRLQLTLTKVQRYLEEFLLQEDKLKVC
ncbi:hypothetical protein CgunFtcFv8_009364 [Champsocephalus gunnari]|uniref:Uncharacterized protein n=1 Tax=Champsocephalus gunnari TaxID=52237 RepID=A0AAN8C274_CHAGU|nr:hypothetical protein CgunFtcFv8_009364 [Champsocephalus gunnari]